MSRKLPRSCCISCCARPAANCSKKWNRRKPSAKRRDCRKSLRRQNKYTGEIKSPPGTILRRGFLFLRCLKLLCTGRAKFTLPTPASFPPVPAFSGFTPASVLHYTRIRSYFRFFPNPVPLLPALLLFLPFTLIPAFALVSDFFSILPRFFRFYSCFRPSLYPHSLLLTSSRHIHFLWFERLHKQADADMPARP